MVLVPHTTIPQAIMVIELPPLIPGVPTMRNVGGTRHTRSQPRSQTPSTELSALRTAPASGRPGRTPAVPYLLGWARAPTPRPDRASRVYEHA